MSIQIVRILDVPNPDTGELQSRTTQIIINGGGTLYYWAVGGLPTSGGLQSILDSRESEFLTAAIASGARQPTPGEIELAEARAWFVSNPQSVSSIFGGTVSDVDANLVALINALHPSATGPQKTGLRYALMAGIIACRTYANVEGLI